MVMIMQRMTKDTALSYFEKYGLRSKTGIDLPSEVISLTKNAASDILIRKLDLVSLHG